MSSITKAIILAAGYGTRFLPATKAMPKEMLPVVDKPVIQYVVEDVVAAGVKDVVIVSSALKRPIEDHFDYSFELEQILEQGGKTQALKDIRAIAELANFIYVRQKGRKGTLAAFQSGYDAIGNEPFFGVWGDDFYDATPSRSKQLLATFQKFSTPVLSLVQTNDPESGAKYGFVTGKEVSPGIVKIESMVEKPGRGQAPSQYAAIGCGLLTPGVMNYYPELARSIDGEIGYNHALSKYLEDGKPLYGKVIDGQYYDCGSKLGYIKSIIEMALKNDEMGPALKAYLIKK